MCAGAWHVLPVPSSPCDTAASPPLPQQARAPLLAHWFNWFSGEKAEEMQQTPPLTRRTSPAPRTWTAAPSPASPPAALAEAELVALGAQGAGSVQPWPGAQVAVSSHCHLLANRSTQKGDKVPQRARAWAFGVAHKGYGPVQGKGTTPGCHGITHPLAPVTDTSCYDILTAVFDHSEPGVSRLGGDHRLLAEREENHLLCLQVEGSKPG